MAQGNTAMISGKVTDQNNESIPGVNVTVKNTTRGTITDNNGSYTLQKVPAGRQTVELSYIGYEKISKTVNVPTSGNVVLNFTLNEATQQLDEVTVRTTTEVGTFTVILIFSKPIYDNSTVCLSACTFFNV
jgi:hypothetical protein